jgi:hypothetical protein
VLLIFLLGAHMAWLNPRPDFEVFGISAWMLADWWKIKRWALRLLVVLAGLVAYLSLLHLPYQSPWEQPSRSRERLEERVGEIGSRASLHSGGQGA